jgi:hypothetical protein
MTQSDDAARYQHLRERVLSAAVARLSRLDLVRQRTLPLRVTGKSEDGPARSGSGGDYDADAGERPMESSERSWSAVKRVIS